MADRRLCDKVTPLCPVEATLYGYRPSLGGNAFLVAIFSICALIQIALALRYRARRSFSIVMAIGTAGEAVGYGGRVMMNSNPWSGAGFKTQIVCLIFCPSFLAAAIYLTLKHLVIHFGAIKSRLKPKLYTWIFISCDLVSILTQSIGGGVAAAAESNPKILDVGDNLMIAGIAFQVVTMFACMCLAAEFGYKVYRQPIGAEKSRELSGKFNYYAICSSAAFVAIFIRCVYRLPEMAGGWGNSLMKNETAFMILDGMMIAIASILLTTAHPAIFFPEAGWNDVPRDAL
ncbi:RTA1-domain-containing protein [Piedraia hortae CBS 480.64]|uniref:RTA1-domain-containing protein n=1 Tax=Piedraia hortae CBS 480.64 TaxID=1314780 RepID=A0A6A7BWJ8_9PEZI|nr:RTA1-domain-containing protein [Piedraia hortae CBS 480.64]